MKKVLFYCLLFFGLQAFGMNHSQPQSIEDPSPSKKISCAELEEQVNIAREEEREIQELKRSTLIEKRMKFRLYLTVAVNESPIPENHPAYFSKCRYYNSCNTRCNGGFNRTSNIRTS